MNLFKKIGIILIAAIALILGVNIFIFSGFLILLILTGGY